MALYVHRIYKKTPEWPLWGFLFIYGELHRGWSCLIISVQPFTNIVASYRCQYRDKERPYVTHRIHLLPAGKSRQPIFYFGYKKTQTDADCLLAFICV